MKIHPAFRMSDTEMQTWTSLPRTSSNHIMDPSYVPPHEKPKYLEQLRAWCKAHDRRDWPEWLQQYADAHRRGPRPPNGTATASTAAGDVELGSVAADPPGRD